jgi:hypothetical protein
VVYDEIAVSTGPSLTMMSKIARYLLRSVKLIQTLREQEKVDFHRLKH